VLNIEEDTALYVDGFYRAHFVAAEASDAVFHIDNSLAVSYGNGFLRAYIPAVATAYAG
jgi:hypothetical protein